jgi:hypothetical protein
MRGTVEQRFWPKVNVIHDVESCWEWTGAMLPYGYGGLRVSRTKVEGAHRLAWTFRHGPIPKGLCVCHRCDNRKCVRVSHLFLGTFSENTLDMHQKGRAAPFPPEERARGSAHGRAKLTEAQVVEIRQRYAAGESLRVLGKAFNVTHVTISGVVRREFWKHVS